MVSAARQMLVDILNVFGDRNYASTFQKPDEVADAVDVVTVAQLLGTVARTARLYRENY